MSKSNNNSKTKNSSPPNAESASSTSAGLSLEAVNQVVEQISKILAPATLLGALLFYYGWIRTEALYQTFGINQSILGFTNQDYILRSINVMFRPLQGLLIAALVGGWLHLAVISGLNKKEGIKWTFMLPTMVAGLILVVGGIYEQAIEPDYLDFGRLVWLVALATLGYELFLLRRVKQQELLPQRLAHIPHSILTLSCWLILTFLILSTFAAVGNYAQIVGRWHADRLVAQAPQIVVHSKEPLGLESGAVTTFQQKSNSIYTHHYRGLRFLVLSNDKYFLVPKDWSIEKPRLIVLEDNETIRLEFAPTVVFGE